MLQRQCEVEQEKKKNVERLMQEEKEHHQQRLQQLQTKFEEEKLLQQQELDRAVECKLTEQKALLQKGFDERAGLLGLEIEQLKKENKGKSVNFLRDYIMPIAEIGKDILSTFCEYKIMRKALKSKF